MSEVIRVSNLGRALGGHAVLGGVSFALEPGERLAVLGPSGSGKTTLLRLIAGLETPSEGEIAIAGRPSSQAGRVLIAPEHREVALVFQGLALFPHLRALQQIAFAAQGRGGERQARRLLERVGLGHRAEARLDELSGGERQRIALARALAQEPRLILMDEPFASLDDEKRAEMRDLLRTLLEKMETTLILVTHSREDALDLARRVLVLDRGRPVAFDLLETVMARPRYTAVVRSLGLGQLIEAEVAPGGAGIPGAGVGAGAGTGEREAQTVFGKVRVTGSRGPGPVRLLVRPSQPRMASDGQGVEAEVVSLELRPPESREVRRVGVLRVGEKLIRVFVRDGALKVGQRVRVCIDGACEVVEGEGGGELVEL